MILVSQKFFAADMASSFLLVILVILCKVLPQLQLVQEDGGAMRAFPEGGRDGDDAAGGSTGLEVL